MISLRSVPTAFLAHLMASKASEIAATVRRSNSILSGNSSPVSSRSRAISRSRCQRVPPKIEKTLKDPKVVTLEAIAHDACH